MGILDGLVWYFILIVYKTFCGGGGMSVAEERENAQKIAKWYDIVNVIYMHTNGLEFSGNLVLIMLTRPLPLPGPWGLPGPYPIFPGTWLKTTPHIPNALATSQASQGRGRLPA